MSEKKSPVIFIDQRKMRIRIHKVTLQMLGDPTYIQILINRQKLMLAIKSCDKRSRCALRITQKTKDSCELYSTNLITLFYDICSKWDSVSQYRLYGKLVPSKGLVYFKMEDGEIYNEQEGLIPNA